MPITAIRRNGIKVIDVVVAFLAAQITTVTAAAEETAVGGPMPQWSLVYTGEGYRAQSGGQKTGSGYLGNLDFTAQWQDVGGFAPDASVFLYVLANHGDHPSETIGDAQTYSNIDAPQAAKIYELWFEQPFAQGNASWKFGLIDLNSEFDVIDSAGLFQNSSFGIGPDFSQSGGNGPSIFPTASLGLRLVSSVSEHGYGQCIALDGVPGDPDNPRGTHIQLQGRDGVLMACEGGYRSTGDDAGDISTKIALGLWRYSRPVQRIDSAGSENNQGLYVLAEREVWQHNDSNVLAFVRVGAANDRVNQFARYTGAGVVLSGVFADDNSDQAGLALAHVSNGDAYLNNERANGNDVGRSETVIELSYRYSFNALLTVQPSLQYIQNPGMQFDDALVFSLRFELSATPP